MIGSFLFIPWSVAKYSLCFIQLCVRVSWYWFAFVNTYGWSFSFAFTAYPMAELYFNNRRVDGRKTTELRTIHCEFLPGLADGSVLLQQGNTKVTASIFGPHPCNVKADEAPDEVCITCQYNRPPFVNTSGSRQKHTHSDKVAAEYAMTIEVCQYRI